MTPADTLAALGVALAADAVAGYPARLFAAIGHPVTWMGALIGALDRRFNDPRSAGEHRRFAGILSLALLLVVTGFVAGLAELGLMALPGGTVLVGLVASSLIAQNSLDIHVAAVATALEGDGLPAARRAVSQIVGRDPETLDRHAVARAAIESLAENFSDGVVAPAVWFLLLGLPGAALYKAANTADSMIGHLTDRHREFGAAAATFDDLVNWPASRLSAVLITAAAALTPGADARAAWAAVRRDARRHRSPNAGWPEAAMAGALGLRLAGPRSYGGVVVADAAMGNGRAEATAVDIARALLLARRAHLILVAAVAALLGLWVLPGVFGG